MQATDIPDWTPKKFAESATGSYVRAVPQTTVDPAAASFDLGFPPQTFTDEGAGGTPPDGRDFNGILKYLSAWAQWVGLGGPVAYNPAVAAAGGYPKGARVLSATRFARIWISTVDNNVTNPDAGGAGWVSDVSTTYSDFTIAGSGTVTVPAWASHAEVHLVGAGGGGAGAGSGFSGGGGGAGGYSFGVINVTPGGSIAYSVGAGGNGGPANGSGSGGGITTFGAFTSFGGFGGNGSPTNTGGGFGGTSNNPGLRGFTGSDGGDGNNGNVNVQGGNGAAGPFGGAGRTGQPSGEGGRSAGSGGGGGWGNSSGTGGKGADGAILIRWLP